jgi:hypothetical protein
LDIPLPFPSADRHIRHERYDGEMELITDDFLRANLLFGVVNELKGDGGFNDTLLLCSIRMLANEFSFIIMHFDGIKI